jgi:hypothetical protein
MSNDSPETWRALAEALEAFRVSRSMVDALKIAIADHVARADDVDWDYLHALGAVKARLESMPTPAPSDMHPHRAIERAIAEQQALGCPDAGYIAGLTHASNCLHDSFALLRYIRTQLPSREPELQKLITSQLIKGCDT